MDAEGRLIAKIPVPMESRLFDVGGRKLRAMVAGSGPPLVLIHGLNIGWGQWYAVLPGLARRHTVFAVDLNGVGAADKVDYLSSDVADLTLTAVDGALRALVPGGATVVGHSIGGWAALKLAAKGHPSIRAVVATDSVGFTGFVPPRFRPLAVRALARLISATVMRPTRGNIAKFLGDVMAEPSVMSPEFIEYVFEHVTRPPVSHPFLLIHRLFRPFRFRPEFVLSDAEFGAIACPVAIVHGDGDPLIPLAAVRSAFGRVPKARVSVLEGVGHVPPIESPERFMALVEEFHDALPR
jgi:pimeloyl-ACP methyl ester carboxylesterase